MFKTKIFYFFFPLVFLFSCMTGPRVSIGLLGDFNIGDPEQDVLDKLVFPAVYIYDIKTKDNTPVSVYIFKRPIAEKSNMIFTSDYYDFCLFSFINSELYFWGTIDDFKRSDSDKIRNIGEQTAYLLDEDL